MPHVSLCRWNSDFAMNLTANLLFQSDKFVIVPHLLLAPANTVVKPAEHEFVRRPSLLLEAFSIESWVEDNNDWLKGKENLSSISGIWLSQVECSISCSVDSPVGLITCARFWIRKTVTSKASWIGAVYSGRDQPWAWARERRRSREQWTWG